LGAAKIQGFTWDKSVYKFDTEPKQSIAVAITKLQYLTLLQRYKELGAGGGGAGETIPFDIDSHITEIDTGKIDADYMNSRFAKYLKELQSGDGPSKEATLAELHRSFTSLSQEDQKLAEIFLHDIQRGDVQIDPARTFRDYLTDYKAAAKDKEVAAVVSALGVHAAKLIALMSTHLTEANLNEYGRFDDLRGTVDQEKAKAYFDGLEGVSLPIFKVKIKAAKLLSDFLLRGGVEGS
jgi:type I restriction enzyme R subunit